GTILDLAVSADGKRAAWTGDYYSLFLWDLEKGRLISHRSDAHAYATRCLFWPDGRRALSSGFDGNLRLWDADPGAELHQREMPPRMTAVNFSPGGDRVVVAGNHGWLRVLEVVGGGERRLPAGTEHVVAASFRGQDEVVAAFSSGRLVRLPL